MHKTVLTARSVQAIRLWVPRLRNTDSALRCQRPWEGNMCVCSWLIRVSSSFLSLPDSAPVSFNTRESDKQEKTAPLLWGGLQDWLYVRMELEAVPSSLLFFFFFEVPIPGPPSTDWLSIQGAGAYICSWSFQGTHSKVNNSLPEPLKTIFKQMFRRASNRWKWFRTPENLYQSPRLT
jgi:hypothetical protein